MPNVWVLLLLAVLFAWLLVRRRRARLETPPSKVQRRLRGKTETAFHAVSLRFEPDACAAAKALAGRRFLSTEAPRLPLDECDAADCKCRFQHYGDRRSGKDRRTPFGSGGKAAGAGGADKERRRGGDRRHDDDDLEDYF